MASPRHPFLAAIIAMVLKRMDDFDDFKYLRNSWSAVIHTTGEEPYTKAIFDVVDLHPPHRLVNMERAFDIADSILAQSAVMSITIKGFYTSHANQTDPLIQQKKPLSWLFSLISTLRQLSRATKPMLAAK